MIREQDYYDESDNGGEGIDENFEQEMQAEQDPVLEILARKATGEIDLKQTLQNVLKNLVDEATLA